MAHVYARSVGAHVRDAACYVCWAFARAYAPATLQPVLTQLARGMLVAAVLDREVNCRRAAAAAFQENVGRQGADNFPHGIDIITVADFFALGSRTRAYLDIAAFVARIPTYRDAIVEHVAEVKTGHWDADVRELAARSLGVLTSVDVDLVTQRWLPLLIERSLSKDLAVRHGSALAVAEIVLACAKASALAIFRAATRTSWTALVARRNATNCPRTSRCKCGTSCLALKRRACTGGAVARLCGRRCAGWWSAWRTRRCRCP